MRAYIMTDHTGGPVPPVLMPYNGQSIINYVIDEVLLQKQIDSICIVLPLDSRANLIQKHLATAYPNIPFEFTHIRAPDPSEHILLDGAVYSTLRLQDLIRYYQQYKTITYSAYDKVQPKPIPFTVYPIASKRDMQITHTYNCGTAVFFTPILASN